MSEKLAYAVLGSGSQANAYAVVQGNHGVLIDNGFSFRELKRRVHQLGFDPEVFSALLVTHRHSDHIRGVRTAAARLGIPVYVPAVMIDSLPWDPADIPTVAVAAGEQISLGPFEVETFPTYHDSPGSMGYTVCTEALRVTVMTDTGKIDECMLRQALLSDVLFLEANYCPDMLENGSYPAFLKQRIASDTGHLSNRCACDLLARLDDKPRTVYLCHLSAHNNSPEAVVRGLAGSTKSPLSEYIVCRRGEIYSRSL